MAPAGFSPMAPAGIHDFFTRFMALRCRLDNGPPGGELVLGSQRGVKRSDTKIFASEDLAQKHPRLLYK